MVSERVIIETENLTKRYGSLTAVNNLNLQVREGEVFGLLGPNGAGKTTTILMMLGLTEPTEGRVRVDGHDPTRDPMAVKRIVGYLPDNVGFYSDLTGKENLSYTADLNGIERGIASRRISLLLDRVGLAGEGDRKVVEYSRGMRQRLGIADILLKEPKIIVLDEPTLGIDPEGVAQVLELIQELARKDGKTVLVSSHLLYQVQQVCDRVGIFVKGELLAAGPIATLGQQVLAGQPLVLEVEAYPNNERLIDLINEFEAVTGVERQNGSLAIECTGDIRRELVPKLMGEGFTLMRLSLKGVSLDDIYRQYFFGDGGSVQ